MLLTELLTLRMLTISTAGSALGGYIMRARKEGKKRLDSAETIKVIEVKNKFFQCSQVW